MSETTRAGAADGGRGTGAAGKPAIDLVTLEAETRGQGAAHGGADDPGAPADRLGICCSGGGIRSAAFNLGVLQVLDRAGVLGRARYLSAVSGGSYIASAYAIATRHSDPELLAEQSAFSPGSPEERWLRNRCSYLAYGVAGKARLVASVLVGVLANVVVLGLVLFATMRPLGWLYGRWQESLQLPAGCGSLSGEQCYRTAELAHLRPWLIGIATAVAVAVLLALVARMFYPGWPLRRWLNRVAVLVLVGAAATAVVVVVLPGLVVLTRNLLGGKEALQPVALGADATSSQTKSGNSLVLGSSVGLLAVVGTAATQLAVQLRAAFGVGKKVAAGVGRFRKLNKGLRRLLVYAVGGLVGPLAVLAGAVLILNDAATRRTPSSGEVVVWAAVLAVTLVVLRYADITSWSMHPFYKQRLSSAFAVVRARNPRTGRPEARQKDYADLTTLSDFGRDAMPSFPELVICAAANVSDPGATPPGSDVVSFVFSPSSISMAAGDGTTTRMDTADYEDRVGERRRADVTVQAAVAMSGAAISPSMGKMTIAPLRFLLALSNVRLGVWLPNPRNLPVGCDRVDGTQGRALVDRIAPANPRPYLLVKEVLGLHRLSSRYVYVTDGGHYENLGLLELVRRRCATIVCLDAAGGSPTSFSTLGQAIALIRAELNVDVSIDPTVIRPQPGKQTSQCYAVGKIHYPDGPAGTLVYVKAAVIDKGPWDVLAFAEKDAVFPAHPTASQLYTGERFEAYRALGAAAGEQAIQALSELSEAHRPSERVPEPSAAT